MRLVSGKLALALLPLATPAFAADLFTVSGNVRDVNVNTDYSLGFSKAQDVINFLGTGKFQAAVPLYVEDRSAVTGTIAFRGVGINLAFGLNSSVLQFSIPVLGESRQFVGANRDRDDALDQLEDYLLENSSDFLRRFQQQLIKSSPNDPTAGNPNSLQSTMLAYDFAFGGFDNQSTAAADSSSTDNKIFLGVQGGTFKAQGVSGQTISAPLSYTVRFNGDPRMQLQFALPITYINQGGAKTGAAAFGVGLQIPLLSVGSKHQWYITPRASIGATGSVDAAAASILGNASITSRFVFDAESLGWFTLANMVGYNWSVPFEVSDVRGDYDIKNTAFKNGVMWEKGLGFKFLGGSSSSLRASYAFTKLTGTDLYMNHYHDVSLSIGTANAPGVKSLARIGLDGSFGRNFKKFAVGFGYTF